MKDSKKLYFLIEATLAVLSFIMLLVMIQEIGERDKRRISVLLPNSEDTAWTSLKYGLKMAAEDYGTEIVFVTTGNEWNVNEEETLIKQEIEKGSDGILLWPASGEASETLLKKMQKKIPLMLVGDIPLEEDLDQSLFCLTQVDDYEMGVTLGKEIINDYNGNLQGKTVGIYCSQKGQEGIKRRKEGIKDALKDTGVKIIWEISGQEKQDGASLLRLQSGADMVIALDDRSLVTAGKLAKEGNLHGSLLYGIGHSTEAIYYLDAGLAECIVVPDYFNMGYQSMTQIALDLKKMFYRKKSETADHTAIRQKELFTRANQEIIFTMSQ